MPLSPNWWLRTGDDPVAVRLIADEGMAEPRFEIVTGAKARAARPDEGTITRGVGRSPWTGETISGDYIKAEAQAGRMGQVLYAVAMKSSWRVRVPRTERRRIWRRFGKPRAKCQTEPGWEPKNIPTEPFPKVMTIVAIALWNAFMG